MPLYQSRRGVLKNLMQITLLPEETYTLWLDIIEAHLPGAGQCTILDVGSGLGHFSIRIARRFNVRVIAIEPNETIRSEAARRNGYSGVIYMDGRADAIPMQGGEARLAFCSDVISRLQDIDAAVAELARTLAPDAHVVVRDCFSAEALTDPLDEFLAQDTASRKSSKDVIAAMKRGGFILVESASVPEIALSSATVKDDAGTDGVDSTPVSTSRSLLVFARRAIAS